MKYENKVNVYVGTDLKVAIKIVAAMENKTVSEFIRLLIRDYISENKEKYENVLRDIDWS